MTDTAVVWFRRDLRLSDNPALHAAVAAADEVVGVFCLDGSLHEPAGAPRRAYLHRCLRALDESMDGNLVVRHGEPSEVIPELSEEVGATTVHIAEDFGPYGRLRDEGVAAALRDIDVDLVTTGTPYAVPPGSVFTKSATPYKVFTPFSRQWREHGWPDPIRTPPSITWRSVAGDGVPDDPDLGSTELPRAGEEAAGYRLDHFLRAKVEGTTTASGTCRERTPRLACRPTSSGASSTRARSCRDSAGRRARRRSRPSCAGASSTPTSCSTNPNRPGSR